MQANWLGITVVFVLVTLWHELGHLVAARWLRIPVKRIGIGFGPTVWRLASSRETELVLRALPLGMAIGVPGRRDANGRLRRPVSHDIWMAAAGPLASLSLPLLLFVVLFVAAWVGILGPALSEWIIGAGLLSVALGVLNLLPLPGLDGGHLLVLAIAQRGWQLSPRRELQMHRVGMQLMIGACLFSLVAQAWQWLAV